jgi:hypothetical protein
MRHIAGYWALQDQSDQPQAPCLVCVTLQPAHSSGGTTKLLGSGSIWPLASVRMPQLRYAPAAVLALTVRSSQLKAPALAPVGTRMPNQ